MLYCRAKCSPKKQVRDLKVNITEFSQWVCTESWECCRKEHRFFVDSCDSSANTSFHKHVNWPEGKESSSFPYEFCVMISRQECIWYRGCESLPSRSSLFAVSAFPAPCFLVRSSFRSNKHH